MRDQLAYAEGEVESYIKGVKVDALNKAKALLADQRSGFERAANEFEEHARDECQKEVARSKAVITSEAISAIQQRETMLNGEASNAANLRSHLTQAQQIANEEAEQTSAVIDEARTAQRAELFHCQGS